MPAEQKAWWPGVGPVTPMAPGIYVDDVGNLHIEVGEMLRFLGSDDTPENRQLVARSFTAEVGQHTRSATRGQEALNAG